MRKTKVVMITSYFDRNGVTSQVMNYATNLNKNMYSVHPVSANRLQTLFLPKAKECICLL